VSAATMFVFTPALDGRIKNEARFIAGCLLFGFFVARYAWAWWKCEKGRAWIVYVIAMVLAAPMWIVFERAIGFS